MKVSSGPPPPATPGEVWTVPADHAYASSATGETIRFAVLSLPTAAEAEGNKVETALNMIAPTAGTHDETLAVAVERLVDFALEVDDVAQMQAESLATSIRSRVFRVYGAEGTVALVAFAVGHHFDRLRDWL